MITKQGDTFDIIAKQVYGDERLASTLMQANPHLLDYIIFPAGLTINVPAVDLVRSAATSTPPWKRNT